MVSNKGTILITGANGGLGKALVSQVLSSPELSQHHGLYTVRDETSSSSSALLSILLSVRRLKAYQDEKWKPIFHDTDANAIDSLAKGSWSTSKDDPSWLSGFRRYGASKLCEVMMIGELQRRLNADTQLNNVCALTVNPGTMSTGLQRSAPWFIRVILFSIIFPLITWLKPDGDIRTTKKSAADVLSAAFDPSPNLGQYPKGLYLDDSSTAEPSAESKDEKKRMELWTASVKYTDLKVEETILANWM
ncbi:putative short-chain dehydrogenase [Ustulina deusta]|nr:putative short-chain dehydrogenase [Ustulina deusta]